MQHNHLKYWQYSISDSKLFVAASTRIALRSIEAWDGIDRGEWLPTRWIPLSDCMRSPSLRRVLTLPRFCNSDTCSASPSLAQ
ncbi:hypothetical protein PFISCL1PPCAC_8287, partial [Pristionchus fissidentatus]